MDHDNSATTIAKIDLYDREYTLFPQRYHATVVMPGQCLDTVGDVNQDFDTMKIVVINLRSFEVELCALQGLIGCGDGHWITNVEDCDDNNLVDGDGCSRDCQVEQYYRCLHKNDGELFSTCTKDWCGNQLFTATYVDTKNTPDEECDDGNFVDNDGCTNCTIDNYYDCRTRAPNTAPDYTTDCHLGCGDEYQLNNVQLYDTTGRSRVALVGQFHTEECDDDNAVDDDGCTDCVTDLGWTCEPFNTCVQSCGNGVLDPNPPHAGSSLTTTDPVEVCDDGNTPTQN